MSGKAVKKLEIWESVTAAKTAIFFDVDTRTLTNWVSRGCPKDGYGKYNLKEVMLWLGRVATSESTEAKKAAAEARFRDSKAKMAEIQVEEKEGKLISLEEVSQEWALRALSVRITLTLLSKKIAALFPERRIRLMIEKVLKDVIQNALEQYSREGKYTPREGDFPLLDFAKIEEDVNPEAKKNTEAETS